MVTRGTKNPEGPPRARCCARPYALEERALEGDADSSRVPFGALRNCKDLAERHRACLSADYLAGPQLQAELSETFCGPPHRLAWFFRRVGNQQAPSQGEQRSGAFGC